MYARQFRFGRPWQRRATWVGFALLSFALTAGAQTVRYVNANCGDDGWGGTSATCLAPNGPFATLSAGIAACDDGDTLRVAPGLYAGPDNRALDLTGKNITLRGTGPNVVLDGDNQVGLWITSGETSETLIEGITFRDCSSGVRVDNGSTPQIRDCVFDFCSAASLRLLNSNATVADCTFRNNAVSSAAVSGAGVYVLNGTPTIADCLFEDNEAQFAPPPFGGGGVGGALSSINAAPIVTGCVFTGNHAEFVGGAVHILNGSPQFTDCTFETNSASQLGGALYNNGGAVEVDDSSFVGNAVVLSTGSGIHDQGGSLQVDRCRFTANTGDSVVRIQNATATVTNSAFWQNPSSALVSVDATPEVSQCTFVDNAALGVGGGALWNFGATVAVVSNSILWDNGPFEIVDEPGSNTTVRSSDVMSGWAGDGVNNIDVDPVFEDAPSGDLHLTDGSPCIDAGDTTLVSASLAVDLDSTSRYHDDPCATDVGTADASIPVVDMGALEFPSVSASLCSSLKADAFSISISGGGSQLFSMEAGLAVAGATFLLLGSFSGTFPGADVGPVHVPLNPDNFLLFTLGNPNIPPYMNTLGVLNVDGLANAAITLSPGLPATFAGLKLNHAYIALSPSQELLFASNAVPLLLIP